MQSTLDLRHGKQPAPIYFLERFYWTRNDPQACRRLLSKPSQFKYTYYYIFINILKMKG